MKRSQPKTIKLFFAAVVLFVAASVTFAERLPVKIYTSADGLGSSYINFVMRDSRGFMWICTRDGLSRFDGSRFVTYQVGMEKVAPGIEIIYETRNGDYWVTTTGGLFRFKSEAVSIANQTGAARPTLNAEFVSDQRGGMLEDRQGNLWYASGRNLFLVKEQEGKVVFEKYKFDLPPNPNRDFGIADIAEDASGSVWVSTSWGLVRRLPDGRIVFYEGETPTTQGNMTMTAAADGSIWLGRALELFIIKPEPLDTLADAPQLTIKSLSATAFALPAEVEKEIRLPQAAGEILFLTGGDFLSKYQTKRLYQTSDKHIWLATVNELIEFDGRAFHRFDRTQGFVAGTGSMKEDAAGNLWIGGRNGLTRFDRKGLTSYGAADGFKADDILAISEAADGTLIFGDGDFYLNRFDGKTFASVRPAIPLESNTIWTSRYAYLDSRNEWWILTDKKLYRFAASDLTKPLAAYTSADGLNGDQMFQIYEDSHGTIWVSVKPTKAAKMHLAQFNRSENRFQSFTEADGLPPNKSASSFAEDTHGNIWLGFYEGGIARFSNGRFTTFNDSAPKELEDGLIGDLHVDKLGRLWLASSINGLYRIDDTGASVPQFVRFTINDGLSSNSVRTITEDRFGKIYLGTVRGVDRLSPDTNRIKHYTINDGLAGDFVNDSLCDKNGVLWFATMGGLSRLVPQPDDKLFAPIVWLGGLRVAGVEQAISQLGAAQIKTAALEPSQNNLQIDFFGMDFRAGEVLRYQYKLEGANADWSEPTEQRNVTFANLSAGDYRFLVRAVNSDGVTSENPAAVSFKILPPIWARWWFLLLAALFAVGIVLFVERYRAARLRELQTAFGELSISEERFRQLIEQSPFGIMIIAPDGSIRAMNKTYLRMWGDEITIEDIKNWDMSADEQMIKGGVVEGLGRAFAGESVTFPPMVYDPKFSPLREVMDIRAEPKWIQAVAYPVKETSGDLREVICVLENITARKIAEENLQKSREERLVELERVRARIATDLHDDIGASLTQIAILSEVAQTKSKAGNGAVAEPLTKISTVTNELVSTMSDIVWSINPAKDHLSDLIQRMRRFASDVLSAKGIALQFYAPNLDKEITINTNIRREVFLIFKESINNVVKHSGAEQVRIELAVTDENLTLEISDNGDGFEPEPTTGRLKPNLFSSKDETGGNGVLSMQKRAAEMNGKIEIVSAPDKGTSVMLNLPLHQTTQAGGDF